MFIKNAIAKPPSGSESFYAALKARTRWTLVTPAIIATYVVVFVLLGLGQRRPWRPADTRYWGGNTGVRTTNGEWWRLVTAMFVHAGPVHLIAEIAGLVQVGLLRGATGGQAGIRGRVHGSGHPGGYLEPQPPSCLGPRWCGRGHFRRLRLASGHRWC